MSRKPFAGPRDARNYPDHLMITLAETGPGAEVRAALDEFDRLRCPGTPTVVVNGERYFGKDRVDWVVDACRAYLRTA